MIDEKTKDAVAKSIYEVRNGPGCTPWSIRSSSHKAPYLADAIAAIFAYESAKPKEAEGWRDLMKELADDLEAEIEARYPPEMREYPSIAMKANLDMEPVRRARAMLSAAGERA